MFGFTETPILAENATGSIGSRRTTADLFDECLHKYVITDAIKDDNVLKFSIEYVGRYKDKVDRPTYVDIPVEDIDTKELLESPVRLEKIADYIIDIMIGRRIQGVLRLCFVSAALIRLRSIMISLKRRKRTVDIIFE